MRSICISVIVLLGLLTNACTVMPVVGSHPDRGSLRPFTANESLEEYLRKARIFESEVLRSGFSSSGGCPPAQPCIEEVVVTAAKADATPSITNNQETGVDEGDIVKRAGDYIVLLRRGRLFSFALPRGKKPLRAVDHIDVAPPEEEDDAWYDEILSDERRIILLGYSHDLEASLIRTFSVARNGELSAGRSYFFKSADYFDSENYATRLVNGRLIFYTSRDLFDSPEGSTSGRIVGGHPRRSSKAFDSETTYQPVQQSLFPTVHTIANCELTAVRLKCDATSLVGPSVQLFYISSDAVYLWLNSVDLAVNYFMLGDRYVRRVAWKWRHRDVDDGDLAVIYRVPLDRRPPTVVQARGWPIDQFSFREVDGVLQVFTRDFEWGPRTRPAILDIPLSHFRNPLAPLPDDRYEYLPPIEGGINVNRFIGSSLLYADTVEDGDFFRSAVWIKNLKSEDPPKRIGLAHVAERIEPVGEVAVVIGVADRDALGLTSMRTGSQPSIGDTTWLKRAVQADERSHSFNFQL